MAMMFGRFEVQGELSKSDTALIYKVMDTETNQVVALKTQSLAPLGDRSDAFVNTLIAEGESTRELASQNIVQLYGAGEIEGQFCAAMEYIQGNSVASMVARKEGFSIWDLLDITRQLCAGLECANEKSVVHCSLEPAKIMVQWDGTVKILGYGISNMSLIEAESGKNLGRLMPYCSPEQIRGEAIDLRSNLFTLGTILYEMVAGRKAFDGADAVALVSQIENDTPADPSSLNSKIQSGVSALIMKAVAKDPAQRYQSARELLEELEQCKEGSKKSATDAKPANSKPSPPEFSVARDPAARAASVSKFATAPPRTANAFAAATQLAPEATKAISPAALRHDAAIISSSRVRANETGLNGVPKTGSKSGVTPVGESNVKSPQSQAVPVAGASAVMKPEAEQAMPRIAIDPLMAEPAGAASGKKFSELAEMPPLKPMVYTPSISEPASPPAIAESAPEAEPAEKLKSQPREVAENALRQIATIPPKLVLYSISGAVALILIIVVAVFLHVHSEDDDSTAAPRPTNTTQSPVAAKSDATANATKVTEAQLAPAPSPVQAPVAAPIQKELPTIFESQPSLKLRQLKKASPKAARAAIGPVLAAAAPVGLALIDSNPQGAQFQVDGKSDPSWITPFTLAGLSTGKHIISVSKQGFASEIRSVEVFAGGSSTLALHLSAINALMVINSSPAGADIIVDGKPTGRVTPSQFAVEKGNHTVLLRKQGYLEETVSADLSPAQNFQYAPALRALGNAADMRTVGKFSKMFGHNADSTAGMGSISIRTQPKGAQVAINQRVLDKLSPVDVMLGPGNYIVDVTLSGFKPIHKIVAVDKGGKAPIDEILERE